MLTAIPPRSLDYRLATSSEVRMSLTKDDEAKLVKALTEATDLAHAFIENKVLDDAWNGAVNNFVDK